MMRLGEFRVGDLFSGDTGDVDLQKRDIDGKGEYFINSGKQNQGIKGRVSRPAKVFPSGTITVDFLGNAYLRDFEYKMATHNHVFSLAPKCQIPHDAMLYIVAALNKLSEIHSFNNMLTWTILQDVMIYLPLNASKEPDFKYMAERIKELEVERIKELEAYLIASGLNDYELTDEDKETLSLSQIRASNEAGSYASSGNVRKEMKEFKVSDLFEKLEVPYYGAGARYSDISDVPTPEYCVPVTTAKKGNNGICRWAREGQFRTYKNVISVVYNGAIAAGLTYYQPNEVAVLTDSYLINLKDAEMNEYNGLYLACAIQKVAKTKFSRENKAVWKRVGAEFISLPVCSNGRPDYNYMAAYIRAQQKLAIADAVELKDLIIKETKRVTTLECG